MFCILNMDLDLEEVSGKEVSFLKCQYQNKSLKSIVLDMEDVEVKKCHFECQYLKIDKIVEADEKQLYGMLHFASKLSNCILTVFKFCIHYKIHVYLAKI